MCSVVFITVLPDCVASRDIYFRKGYVSQKCFEWPQLSFHPGQLSLHRPLQHTTPKSDSEACFLHQVIFTALPLQIEAPKEFSIPMSLPGFFAEFMWEVLEVTGIRKTNV